MEGIISDLITLGMLIMLQAVLGFDNLLYISLESQNAPEEKQSYVRKVGIFLAIFLRIALLFILLYLIQYFQTPWFHVNWEGVMHGEFTGHSLIVFFGGGFIVYTAMKEIWHMMALESTDDMDKPKEKSTNKAIFMIVIMNLVFSFDSILSAIALTDTIWVMATAIVLSGLMMIWLADRVTTFLKKNRMYEVLGLFVLFLVGVMLLTEAGHLAHLSFFGNEITQMSKTTFYFVIVILVVVDIVQGRYQKKIVMEQEREQRELKA